MLDKLLSQDNLWDQWKQSEGQLLQFQYFLGNQGAVSTDTKSFFITVGTKLKVEEVIFGERVNLIVNGIKYSVTELIINIPERRVSYMSGKEELEYVTGGHKEQNLIRNWFKGIEKDSD